jgi:hypothetical protein
MCITSAEVRAEQEAMVWDILCDKCKAKAEALLEKREALTLFDIDRQEYGFCPECTAQINDALDRFEEAEIGGEIP